MSSRIGPIIDSIDWLNSSKNLRSKIIFRTQGQGESIRCGRQGQINLALKSACRKFHFQEMFGVILVSSISTVTRVIGESDRKVCPFLSNIRLVMNAIQASLSDQAKKAPQAFTLQFITDPAGCKTTTRQSVWPAYTPHAPSKRSVCPPADPES